MARKTALLYLLIQTVLAKQSDLQIRTLLMDEKLRGYNRKIPPTTLDNGPVQTQIGFGINSLVDINERDQSLTFNGWIIAFWIDQRLAWNLTDYNISTMFYSQGEIWIPDLWIENSLMENHFLGYDDLYCFVHPLGSVLWSPGGLFKSRCEIDVTYFPFDSQLCNIVVSSWVLDQQIINFLPANETVHGYEMSYIADSANSLWDIMDLRIFTKNAFHLPAGAVGLQISLRRCSVFYVINLIFPLICISSLLCLVFALPIDQGDRISLAMSTLLTFVVFLTLLNEYLPQTSRQTSILTIYLTTLFLIGTISVVLAVFTLRLSSLEDTKEIPAWLKQRIVHQQPSGHGKPVSCFGRKIRVHDRHENSNNPPEPDEHLDVDGVKWMDVARYIDRILMYTFLTTIMITNILYFVVTFAGTGWPYKC